MSVIVKGMEMPQTGWECPINWRGVCGISGSHYCQDKRPNWCPLRPLPEKHGRLGDLDEIMNKLARDKRKAFTKHDVWLMLSCYGVETIVEAEGED